MSSKFAARQMAGPNVVRVFTYMEMIGEIHSMSYASSNIEEYSKYTRNT